MDLPLNEKVYVRIGGHGNHVGVSVTFVDSATNTPLVSPSGVRVEMVANGRSVHSMEQVFGMYFLEAEFDYRISGAGGAVYELSFAKLFRVHKVESPNN